MRKFSIHLGAVKREKKRKKKKVEEKREQENITFSSQSDHNITEHVRKVVGRGREKEEKKKK